MSPAAAPAATEPTSWPETELGADVNQPRDDPRFRHAHYRFRQARLLAFRREDVGRRRRWRGRRADSLGVRGELVVHSRDADTVTGSLSAILEDVPIAKPVLGSHGRLEGDFEADIVDCSEWKGPYPT